jgi:hypothetical protein
MFPFLQFVCSHPDLTGTVKIENEHTLRLALERGINFFLGAGFSTLARDSKNATLPLGFQLKLELIQEFGKPELSSLPLEQLCTILETTKHDALRRFVNQRFAVTHFDGRYRNIDNCAIRTIFTTNVDDLLFKIFRDSKRSYLNDLSQRGPVANDRLGIDYLPLHGSIVNEYAPLAFSSLDVASAFQRDPDKWHFFTGRLQLYPTLFWGYSVSDAGALQALSPATIHGREHQPKWIVLLDPDAATEEYFRALGFNIIHSDTSQMLDFVGTISIPNNSGQARPTSGTTREIFPEEAVPSIGEVPARPLLEFYLGGAPDWYNIFTNRIYRTSNYTKVAESINSGKNTVVIGIPACGKSTLMMQIAAGIKFEGHTLVSEYLTSEKVQLLSNRLGNDRALLLIDNAASDADAFDLALRLPNILVVGFDRDYLFDIVSHRFDRSLFNVVDVTGLTEKDTQEIFTRIPPNIRPSKLRWPAVAEGVPLSIFELIDTNTTTPGLSARFNSVLQELEENDATQHDLLVMISYVHTCQTAVSIDMIRAFLDTKFTDYRELYERLNKLGAMVAEYQGAFVDSDQDHFTPRSTIVSEAIVQEVSSRAFRRVLVQFHNNVSTFRICRYDIFKRRAFDERFATKAFTNWREGEEFYERMKAKDDSPYLGQQCALYLSHRRRYSEAFRWIDEALLESGYRIPSIRHSHAIILFGANYLLAQAGEFEARQYLDESMRIIAECYDYDKRKTYHALTFGDQALKYYKLYSDDTAMGYVVTAKQWLLEEQNRVPWNRNVRRVLRELSRI